MTNYSDLLKYTSGLNESEKNRILNYFDKSFTHINNNYKQEELYKKQLVVWIIKNIFREIRFDQVESFIDEWFKRANLTTEEMIKLKESYVFYSSDNDLYLGLAHKIMEEKKNESNTGFKGLKSLFTF